MLVDGTKRQEEGENTMLTQGGSNQIQGTSVAGNPGMGQMTKGGPTKSGSWTNLNQYLDRNQANISQTAGRVGQTTSQLANQAQQRLGQAEQAGQQANQNLTQLKENQDFVQSAFEDPTAFVQDQTNLERFRGLRDTLNANPAQTVNQFNETATQAATEAGQTAQRLKALQSQGGLTNELRQIRQTPRYSAGSQALDRFLLTGSDQGRNVIEGAVGQGRAISEDQRLQNVANQINQTTQGLNQNLLTADQIKNMTNQQQQDYINSLGPINQERMQAALLDDIFGGDAEAKRIALRDVERYNNNLRTIEQNKQGQARLNDLYGQIQQSGVLTPELRTQLQGILRENFSAPQFGNYNPLLGTYNATTPFEEAYNNIMGNNWAAQNMTDAEKARIIYDTLNPTYSNNIAAFTQGAETMRNREGFSDRLSQVERYNQANANPTTQNALRQNEVARLRALAQLSGLSVDDFLGARI